MPEKRAGGLCQRGGGRVGETAVDFLITRRAYTHLGPLWVQHFTADVLETTERGRGHSCRGDNDHGYYTDHKTNATLCHLKGITCRAWSEVE